MQGWMTGGNRVGGSPTKAFAQYRERTGADPRVYSFDLQGYGTLMFPERNVYVLAGFSEKVFDVMALLERDRESRVPGSGVRGRGSGERETTASSLAGKQQAREKEDNGGQGKDGPAGAIAQGGNGR